jgi:hypothetical protein
MSEDTKLQVVPPKTRVHDAGPDDPPEVGEWYWLKVWEKDWDAEKEDYGEPYIMEVLCCVVEVGSNYAELRNVGDRSGHSSWRIHEDEFDTRCRFEPDAQDHIDGKIQFHQANVNDLMNEVKQLTAGLGITRQALMDGGEDQTVALTVVHGTENVKAHKTALIKAKEKTLPDLFKKIEEEHEAMACWMKANLIPYEAEAKGLKRTTKAIEDKIFTVELYAGLVEEMVQIRKGKPAPNDTKIHLMQRRHYMDEECLWNYQAGGMEFDDIKQFDKWLAKKENALRILPHPRCIVAFQVRRKKKERRSGKTLSDFISIILAEQDDKKTFLYIRNGNQLWRLSTGIDFGEDLFPHKEDSITLSDDPGDGPLWADVYWGKVKEIISNAEYESRQVEHAEAMERYKVELAEWRADPKNKKHLGSIFEPDPPGWHRSEKWEQVTKESVYYDDAMKQIAREAMAHNRVVVVLQGILDRSPALHPHPPWQLFTAEGFTSSIELVYDTSRALVSGDPPDFKAYMQACNESLKRGCVTVGQQTAWLRAMAQKENEVRRRRWYEGDDLDLYKPYGNPGPGDLATVDSFSKKGCTFRWERERLTYSYRNDSPIKTSFRCPASKLFNVSAYKPGDYKQFYNDPRTRADYDRWAPFLLAAEDWHAEQAKKKK